MIDHCISAFRITQEDKVYRIYVTDALRAIVGDKNPRYYDLITPVKQETRTADEIKEHIVSSLKKL